MEADDLQAYFKLSRGHPVVHNFASLNPNYTFDVDSRFLYAQWEPQYETRQVLEYNEKELSLVNVTKNVYHNICPLYTYRKDNYCYSEPVNQPRLIVFPQWNKSSEELDFIFTMAQGSFIIPSVIQDLQPIWYSPNPLMQKHLDVEIEGLAKWVKSV